MVAIKKPDRNIASGNPTKKDTKTINTSHNDAIIITYLVKND